MISTESQFGRNPKSKVPFSPAGYSEFHRSLGGTICESISWPSFLKVKDRLAAKENELQELNNRAGGEVVIRQALNELDVWEVEAKFSFVDHQTSVGETVPLIKDWKDTLNKVRTKHRIRRIHMQNDPKYP